MSATHVDPVARHLSPALWSIVYGPLSQAGRFVAPLVDAARDTSPFHPDGDYPGLTETQLYRLLCWNVAQVAVNGHLPLYRIPLELAAFRIVDEAHPVVRFASLVHAALTDDGWTAPYLRDGWREQGLDNSVGSAWSRDWSRDFGPSRHGVPNPCSYVKLISPRIVDQVAPPGMTRYRAAAEFSSAWSRDFRRGPATGTLGWDGAHTAFDVPEVLASLWHHASTDDLCLVLFNWTELPGSYGGTFIPWRSQGWGGNWSGDWSRDFRRTPRFSAYRLHSGRSDWNRHAFSKDFGGKRGLELVRSGLRGRTGLECSGTEGSLSTSGAWPVLSLGEVPARSVRAFVLKQE